MIRDLAALSGFGILQGEHQVVDRRFHLKRMLQLVAGVIEQHIVAVGDAAAADQGDDGQWNANHSQPGQHAPNRLSVYMSGRSGS